MKHLVIAEKPSVAQTIARVLKANTRKDGYVEGSDYIISWCVGHLVSPASPEAYDERYKKWSMDTLPIIPETWLYEVIPSTSKQYRVLAKLMKSASVSDIICATDAGREGELIFRLVYNKAGCKKPCKRLWISSLEEQSIRDGFENLRPSSEFDNLYHAAMARSKADWLIGMNASRLYSLKHDKNISVGRVQTPVLNMLVERDNEIKNFQEKKYYTAELDCGGFFASSGDMERNEDAADAVKTCDGQSARVVNAETEHKTTSPPKLYDLTALQRDANKAFGYSAKQTLVYAQSLYECKLITYPRTDSRYITSDVAQTIPMLIETAADKFGIGADFTADVKRITDNSKVSDHHALLPTLTLAKKDIAELPSGEKSILELICRGLIRALAPPYKYDSVKLTLECEGMEFTASGKTVTDMGFKAYDLANGNENVEESARIPKAETGDVFEGVKASVKAHKTKPPKAYTDDTLLSAMEKAVNTKGAERAGLGTPATRADIIEKLVLRGFAERSGRKLLPTDKGKRLTELVPESVKSADMTADWEERLAMIAKGEQTEQEFINGITQFVRGLIESEQ